MREDVGTGRVGDTINPKGAKGRFLKFEYEFLHSYLIRIEHCNICNTAAAVVVVNWHHFGSMVENSETMRLIRTNAALDLLMKRLEHLSFESRNAMVTKCFDEESCH